MKKLLTFCALLLSVASFAAPKQVFMKASFGSCEMKVNSKTLKTVARDSICTVGPEGTFCITNTEGYVNRTYIPAKVSVEKISGIKYFIINDGINVFFFGMNKDKFSFLYSDFLYKGIKGKLNCLGTYKFIPRSVFLEEGQKWTRNKKNKKSGRII